MELFVALRGNFNSERRKMNSKKWWRNIKLGGVRGAILAGFMPY